ncbi:nucleotidyltransferase domain-containing protein [Clostridium sp. 'White wine YQ']|uniref:nucleotidyltransferase domain-containing protein n=1 Tax=Clostridium sp. 'White wine YQ' TaxID=3027474 RepID=UPI0023659D79|nr:nucleotidyltransferase domain-containing protein [Clostridium sp. 'White wine YQ']MDD7796323.1 nucleotidyltransferase domain-containing protein [Clostridium sp. 'White wine YQ']
MEIEMTIDKIKNALKKVRGIECVVLGGSRAKGSFSEKSDIDIGIYYSDRSKLDLESMSRIATELDDTHRSNLITKIGEWGPWINGGGWLNIDGITVDFLLRDLNKVGSVIDECLNGKITIDYQAGHPHGFVNSIYVAEIFYCKILLDENNNIAKLKDKITPYPHAIKRGIVEKFLWEAGFSCSIASKSVAKKDIVYAYGCFYRAVSCLTQVVYALNETYIMNEKGALTNACAFKITPRNFEGRIEKLFCSLTAEPEDIENLIEQLSGIIKEVEELCKKYI